MEDINKTEQITIASEITKDNLVTQLTPDALRTIFAMCFGRPDSLSKVINRQFRLTPGDLLILNDKINDSLNTHSIVANATSITIKFAKNKIVSLENWSEFQKYDWMKPEIVKYVELRWDFFIGTKLYKLPQRHSLSVKISSDVSPLDIFRMMASNATSTNDFEKNIALCYVNVDFIHHALADELVHIVSEWAESLPLVAENNKFGNWCNNQKDKIAKIIHLSIPFVFFFCISISLFLRGNTDFVKNNQVLIVFCTLALLNFSIFAGRYLASKAYSALDYYEAFSPFNFTSGDKKNITKTEKENKKKIRCAIFSFVVAFLLNLLCSILTTYIVK